MTNNWITPDWPVPLGIRAASTLRTGGISRDNYSSWNCAAHVGDNPADVNSNRLLLKQQLQLPSEPLWLNQVHGCLVVNASTVAPGITADASYSRTMGIVCTVMTADCLPLLLCAKDGAYVAAVHCGWRSLLAGIIEQTICSIGSSNLLAWMGPAIGPQAFIVGTDVRQLFIDKSPNYEPAFVDQGNGKWLADLYSIARIKLGKAGIQQVYGGDRCTYNEDEHFFSHRRQGTTGRMATMIWKQT